MDQVSRALLAVGGGVAAQTYVDDVFSTYLYTGSGSLQTITNGINLSTNGGMVWIKNRTIAASHVLTDTVRGAGNTVSSDLTDAQVGTNFGVNTFLSTGFTVANNNDRNNNSTRSYASWAFRKAPKFFDVVTYTGNGGNRDIAHSLGSVPGVVIVKQTSGTGGDWFVNVTVLSGAGNTEYLRLNSTGQSQSDGTVFRGQDPTATTFPVGTNSGVNANSATYVAYLFAHDTAADGLIQCGSFTTDGSGNATVTSLGWEPQFLMVKASSTTGDWIMLDSMRGWNMTASDASLLANSSGAESTATNYGNPTATGFSFSGGSASATYIYMAIRRSNKPPTSGTSVFSPHIWTGNSSTGITLTPGFAADLFVAKERSPGSLSAAFADKMRGPQRALTTASTSAEIDISVYSGSGVNLRNTTAFIQTSYDELNHNTASMGGFLFRRAPGFFDVVCYTGNGSTNTVNHNLGAVPEFMIVKSRSGTTAWLIYSAALGNNASLAFTTSAVNTPAAAWNTTSPTSAVFTLGAAGAVNGSGATYVAYLFASLPGISKVGTYTGNGTFQTINCGFTAGVRFVLIKRTDAAGDWYVFDSARGIVLGVDPALALNSTAAEVTLDVIDQNSVGFGVEQNASVPINTNAATYLYLAIA